MATERFAHPLPWMATGAAAWLAALVAAPALPARLALLAYAVGGLVCHQIPVRSFHIGEAQLAVCARCSGIYAGAAAAFVWQLLALRAGARSGPRGAASQPARVLLAVGVAPTVLTVALELTGVWAASNLTRAIAGVAFGAAAAMVAGEAATLHYERWRQRRLA